jgi:hypothetical protein
MPSEASQVSPLGHAPPVRQSGTHVPAHGWPLGQQTWLAAHVPDDAHEAPAPSGIGPTPASPGGPEVEVYFPFKQRWMKGYVSVT